MKLYVLHAYGLEDGVQITENQKLMIDKVLEDSSRKDTFIKVNGFSIKVSAIATIEPKEENAKEYLIEQYDKEAEKGLHALYSRKKFFDNLTEQQSFQFRLATGDLTDEEKEKQREYYDNAPKRSEFVNSMEYVKAKTNYYKEK